MSVATRAPHKTLGQTECQAPCLAAHRLKITHLRRPGPRAEKDGAGDRAGRSYIPGARPYRHALCIVSTGAGSPAHAEETANEAAARDKNAAHTPMAHIQLVELHNFDRRSRGVQATVIILCVVPWHTSLSSWIDLHAQAQHLVKHQCSHQQLFYNRSHTSAGASVALRVGRRGWVSVQLGMPAVNSGSRSHYL